MQKNHNRCQGIITICFFLVPVTVLIAPYFLSCCHRKRRGSSIVETQSFLHSHTCRKGPDIEECCTIVSGSWLTSVKQRGNVSPAQYRSLLIKSKFCERDHSADTVVHDHFCNKKMYYMSDKGVLCAPWNIALLCDFIHKNVSFITKIHGLLSTCFLYAKDCNKTLFFHYIGFWPCHCEPSTQNNIKGVRRESAVWIFYIKVIAASFFLSL